MRSGADSDGIASLPVRSPSVDAGPVPDRPVDAGSRRWPRRLGVAVVIALLVGAIVVRRATIADAVAEIGRLPVLAVLGLVVLAAYERWSRADITARLLGSLRTRDGFVVHDVGNAASKGVPMGGAIGTALRWSIVRRHEVTPVRFTTMLVAYGVATTLVTWVLPLIALLVDLVGRNMTATDGVLVLVLSLGALGQVAFWYVALGSDRVERWSARFTVGLWNRLSGRVAALRSHQPAEVVADVRRELRAEARSPVPLLVRTALAQACGSLILLVALRALGVGDELGVTEFFRLFFVTHLLGTFAPTPGGVGVVEAGMSGALVAAGVDPTSALAGVLVYRFLTYVLPILTGTGLFLVWRRTSDEPRRGGVHSGAAGHEPDDQHLGGHVEGVPVRVVRGAGATLDAHGSSIDTELPHLPCAADQGLRHRRHVDGDVRAEHDRGRLAPR